MTAGGRVRRGFAFDRRHADVAIWFGALAVLVAFRIGLPLVVRANAGSSLPLLPRYDDVPLNGDANGYYEAVSNVIDSYEHVLRPHGWWFAAGLTALVVTAAVVAVIRPGPALGPRWSPLRSASRSSSRTSSTTWLHPAHR